MTFGEEMTSRSAVQSVFGTSHPVDASFLDAMSHRLQ
jgi:hypothetical protein